MMGVSTRGVKYKFSEGEKVLCYEPDPTKAKVLYESKVLQLVSTRNERGRKVTEYLVHFYGWNSSWDRFVTEESILPYTEENRELQRKLSEKAAIAIKDKRKGKSFLSNKDSPNKHSESTSGKSDRADSSLPSSEMESSEDEGTEREVVIQIPDVLKIKLEEDAAFIKRNNKLVKLPCSPNAVDIFEDYVKYMAQKLLIASPPRSTKGGKQLVPTDVDKKITCCKEVMDGLRIYFDSTLRHLLLYREEKVQFYTAEATCVPIIRDPSQKQGIVLKLESNSSDVKLEPNSDSANSISSSSETYPIKKELNLKVEKVVVKTELLSSDELSPVKRMRGRPKNEKKLKKIKVKSYRLKYPVITVGKKNSKKLKKSTLKQETAVRSLRSCDKSILPAETLKLKPRTEKLTSESTHKMEVETLPGISHSPEVPSMRITRHSAQQATISLPQLPTLHFSYESVPMSSESPVVSSSYAAAIPNSSVTYRNAPSSSRFSNCMSSSSGSNEYHESDYRHKVALQEILDWEMLPPHFYNEKPPASSLIYGAHHLLRLFVILPDLISKMHLSNRRIEILQNTFDGFLAYMAEKKDDLLSSSVYIDCNDYNNGNV